MDTCFGHILRRQGSWKKTKILGKFKGEGAARKVKQETDGKGEATGVSPQALSRAAEAGQWTPLTPGLPGAWTPVRGNSYNMSFRPVLPPRLGKSVTRRRGWEPCRWMLAVGPSLSVSEHASHVSEPHPNTLPGPLSCPSPPLRAPASNPAGFLLGFFQIRCTEGNSVHIY